MLRHRRWISAVWLVLFLAGGVAAGRLSERLTLDFSLPGQPCRRVRVVDLASTGDDIFVTDDGASTFALVQGPLPTDFGPGIEAEVERCSSPRPGRPASSRG